MEYNNILIRTGRPNDAGKIAEAIFEAVGEEATSNFAGTPERLPLVKRLFTELAVRDDSQYSYRNALVAETADGEVVGVAISYDGADLHTLRERFFEKADEILGLRMSADNVDDETVPDEIYLDTLCVFEPYRQRGIASRLIKATVERHRGTGKPVGLLVDKNNIKAQKLYEKNGFREVGETPFFGILMNHMQCS